MRVKSILKTVCTCGLVRFDSTMRCAMIERMRVSGTSSPGAGVTAGAAAGLAVAAGAAVETGAGAGAPPFSMYARMSSFVTRPPAPVPCTALRLMLCSRAILRTSGEERTCSASSVETGCAAGALTLGAGAAAAACAGAGAAAAGAAPSPAPPITATTVLICTVCPAGILISVRTPAAGEGISASTLSVEISKSGSSRWTVSPTFFSHLVMVPSKMDSPICGMMTSWPGPAAAAAGFVSATGAEAAGAGAVFGASVFAATGAAGAVAAAEAPSPMMPTTAFTCTVEPSWARISVSTPAAGDGISASTLSVEISKSGSSRSTVSPGFLSHFVIVPSKIDSPIWGIRTSVGMGISLRYGQGLRGAARLQQQLRRKGRL